MEFELDGSLKEWVKDKPLSILQLDPADRAVLRIAGDRISATLGMIDEEKMRYIWSFGLVPDYKNSHIQFDIRYIEFVIRGILYDAPLLLRDLPYEPVCNGSYSTAPEYGAVKKTEACLA
ncbi:hypothetical protein K0M31_015963 [Melipona bicolor]|uniref:Uncharacterized protein n=1 Tax=Melipona bicolor TaxID=60889 RepID=A0AA40G626_9HYME|nr:hypothetical protein K0M31_015963 [Melipona bicolor]